MGRGLSDNQRAVLIHVYKRGESIEDLAEEERALNDDIESRGYRGHHRTWIQYKGPGVWAGWMIDTKLLGFEPVFGGISILGNYRKIQSDVERASVARSITRLCKRGLAERRGGRLVLSPEGFELAKQLSGDNG